MKSVTGHQKEDRVPNFKTNAWPDRRGLSSVQIACNFMVDTAIWRFVQVAADRDHGPIGIRILGKGYGGSRPTGHCLPSRRLGSGKCGSGWPVSRLHLWDARAEHGSAWPRVRS